MTRFVATLLAVCLATGCATLSTSTQRVRVVTEPTDASIAALEDSGRKDLGRSPINYQATYQAYHCSKLMYLLPVALVLAGFGGGFGLAYGTTHRNDSLGRDDRVNAGLASGALFAGVGLGFGVGFAAECLMKDGETPDHHEARVIIEAHKDGFLPQSATLKIPSDAAEIRLELPPVVAPTEPSEQK
jgi:hypothetical protein